MGQFQSGSPNPPYTWYQVLPGSTDWTRVQLGSG